MLYLFLILMFIDLSSAAASEDLQVFQKCVKLFINEPLEPSNSLYLRVKRGEIDGVAACMEILNYAHLHDQGNGTVKIDEQNKTKYELGKRVLRTFNIGQRSFFDTSFIENFNEKDYKIYDYNDRSYYLLRHLFTSTPNSSQFYRLSEIFTDDKIYGGLRDSANKNYVISPNTYWHPITGVLSIMSQDGTISAKTGTLQAKVYAEEVKCSKTTELTKNDIDYEKAFISKDATEIDKVKKCFGDYRPEILNQVETLNGGRFQQTGVHDAPLDQEDISIPNSILNENGALIGLREKPTFKIDSYYFYSYKPDGYNRSWLGPLFKQNKHEPVEVNQNLGAGILFPPSTQSTFMDTLTLRQDGAKNVPRQWVNKFLGNFLCRQLPVIRASDAAKFVEPKSEMDYRRGSSCMGCHATMDNLSYIARGYRWLRTDVNNGNSVHLNFYMKPHYTKSVYPISAADRFFVARPADGHFRFRDMYGAYHDVALNSSLNDPHGSFRELGQYLSNLDDTYACLTSKYFDWFTGTKIDLHDPADKSVLLDSSESKKLEFIKRMGKELRQHQNLKLTLKEIISSPYFLESN